jgi:hypothetical protein
VGKGIFAVNTDQLDEGGDPGTASTGCLISDEPPNVAEFEWVDGVCDEVACEFDAVGRLELPLLAVEGAVVAEL